MFTCTVTFNPFYATGLFQYPLGTSGILCFSGVLSGYRKRPVAWNGLIVEALKIQKAKVVFKPAMQYSVRRISDYITAQKAKFSMKDSFSKCDQILSFLRIWSHLLKKTFMENFIFCAERPSWDYSALKTSPHKRL